MSSLFKQVCVVTGASRGIGRAVAEDLASAGAQVATCAVQDAPRTGDWRVRCDVSDEEQVSRFFADLEMRLGPPDVLVINAGVLERAPIDELSARQWDRVLAVNLRGAFLCARAAWPSMKSRRKGRILAIGSISGTLGTPLASAYNASKWGLTMMDSEVQRCRRPAEMQRQEIHHRPHRRGRDLLYRSRVGCVVTPRV